jgi:hypothetical protein
VPKKRQKARKAPKSERKCEKRREVSEKNTPEEKSEKYAWKGKRKAENKK